MKCYCNGIVISYYHKDVYNQSEILVGKVSSRLLKFERPTAYSSSLLT